jgi:hypothetical protein
MWTSTLPTQQVFSVASSRNQSCVRFVVLMAVRTMSMIFWDVTLRSLVDEYRRFGGSYCLHLQGWRGSRFLRSVGTHLPIYVPSHPRKPVILIIISLLSLFWRNESRFMRSPCCLCVCESRLSPFECLTQSLWNLVFHVTWVHLSGVLYKSLSPVCVAACASPHIVTRQRLGRHVPLAANRCNNRRIVGGVVFYTIRVVSREGLWVCLCIPYYR